METQNKQRKHRKGGTDYAKEKLAKAEAKVNELENKIKEQEDTIFKQSATISELTAGKANSESDLRYYKAAADKYWKHMGWFRRWLYVRKEK